MDCYYLSESEFDNLYEMAGVIRSKIAGFIKYLLEFEKKKKSIKKP